MSQIRRKLIEVALPLEAINKESAREKSIRHGHPSTLHLWWARRPLAACRAVLFASLVDDPSSDPKKYPTEAAQEKERQRLFRIIEDLVKWENSNNPQVLGAARAEIMNSTGGNPPPVLDPFCGGGSIPLEAQRLGLEAHGSDLNPVAVLITKALIEIPPKFAGKPPVNPEYQKESASAKKLLVNTWQGAKGLAADVRYYGQWMREEAIKRIGHLYPKVKLPKEHGGGDATVIAWLWARTVKCPNPACGAQMPLVRAFALSTKKGKEAWVEPRVDKKGKRVEFEVMTGSGRTPEGTVNRCGARCVCCDTAVPFDHVRSEGKAGRISSRLMAIVAEGAKGRVYLPPNDEHENVVDKANPQNVPDTDLPKRALGFRVQVYGMTKHRDLFTPRQLVALTTFSDLVGEARERVLADADKAGMAKDGNEINGDGIGVTAYAEAVALYLAFGISKLADYATTLCRWFPGRDSARSTFGRQALPMSWDYTELNPLHDATGSFRNGIVWTAECLQNLGLLNGARAGSETVLAGRRQAHVVAACATVQNLRGAMIISTDPPYYDNIGYGDLSDFFYVWLRRSLGKVYTGLFSTLLVPKEAELIASPYRFDGSKGMAQSFFEKGLGRAFEQMRKTQHPDYPLTVYYAFKQAENDEEESDNQGEAISSTGWETMLDGLLGAGFSIHGTWPLRTEATARLRAAGSNALASSIVLVCRLRPQSAPVATRKDFLSALKKELPAAIKKLQQGNIAPVDLAQASIGPGMAVFSRYSKVLEADGQAMTVRSALQIINQELDASLSEQEGDMDRDTRFCLAWFQQFGMNPAPYGEAETLSRAKNTSCAGLVDAGVAESKGGKFHLLKRDEYSDDWDPATDERLTVWECTQHLIRTLDKQGEGPASKLAARLGGGRAEEARALAYRLYSICERRGWAQEAMAYNSLVVSWSEITRLMAGGPGEVKMRQKELKT